MTVRDETTIADKEDENVNSVDDYVFTEVVSAEDAYGTGGDINVPFASAITTTETSAYGSSPTYAAAAITNIIPAVQTQSTPMNVEGQSGNEDDDDNQGCLKNRKVWSIAGFIIIAIVFFFTNSDQWNFDADENYFDADDF
jgi:hypothetical protein